MPETKNRFEKFISAKLQLAGIVLLVLLSGLLLWHNRVVSTQATSSMVAQVYFDGEYSVDGGAWQKTEKGRHIPATKGDVRLRGYFHLMSPDGEYIGLYNGDIPIAFYVDHINVSFIARENEAFVMDIENPLYGSSACGTYWTGYIPRENNGEPVEILIHNPHRFGNETAIDEMLSGFALWSGIDFEKTAMESGKDQRNTGIFFLIVSFTILGAALSTALLHIPLNRLVWLLGASILSAGIYLAYSAPGVSFWRESIADNTSILGFSMMFYMLFVSGVITCSLEKSRNIGRITTALLGIAIGIFLLLPALSKVYFYDTWLPWVIVQSGANLVFLYCLAKEFISADKKNRWIHIGLMLLLLAYEADVFATALGYWQGGFLSKYVFFALFVAALFVVLRLIPEKMEAAEKAKEFELQRSRLELEKNKMEAELKESRISIMLSQIKPHFIYNTLGTIERMCLKDPQKAFDLVRNFSLYLRGNFSELDSVTPIRFTEELKHVEHYVNIEKVRFPDMDIRYAVECKDFVLPALSVQPLVENAIKHGLMRLESGGTVLIRSYETESHFCVEVKDDGVGFDTNAPIDGKKHVGLRNIRGRLKAMVNGELILQSEEGVGTKALIMIPKEVTA